MSQTRIKQQKGWFARIQVAAVSPEELTQAMNLVQEALDSDETVLTREVGIIDEHGEMQTLAFDGNNPLIKRHAAIARYCGDDKQKHLSLTTRLDSLQNILHTDECMDWLVYDLDDPDPDSPPVGIHPAVIDVAATFPVRVAQDFNPKDFFQRVQALAASKYPDIAVTYNDDAGGE